MGTAINKQTVCNRLIIVGHLCVFFHRKKLFDLVNKAVYGNFRVHMDQVLTETGYVPEGEKLSNEHAVNIFFGNYMEPDADPKIYDQVQFIMYT